MRTYQSLLSLFPEQELLLDNYADLFSQIERKLFADFSKGKNLIDCKNEYLMQYGITARQFNAIRVELQGKIASIKERRAGLISELVNRITKAKKVITKIEDHVCNETKAERSKSLPGCLHQKKRRLGILETKLKALEADHKEGKVRICFGTKKLFHSQFFLEENGYNSHKEWSTDWTKSRNNQFSVLGSKDETSGRQGCEARYLGDGKFALQLRLPNALVENNQGSKYLFLETQIKYGKEQILNALASGQAISYRFVKDEKGYRVFFSTKAQEVEKVSRPDLSRIAVDINADHLAVTDCDRFGNPLLEKNGETCNIPLVTYGLNTNQAEAVIGDAVKQVITKAIKTNKPISIEALDFSKKKAQLEGESKKQSRMLSSFSYNKIKQLILARAKDAGIEVIEINPAFTSIIGKHKFSKRYGISSHQGAALAIARRTMNLSERPNRQMNNHSTFPLPVRNREKHVWSFWGKVAKKEAVHVALLRREKRLSSSLIKEIIPTQSVIKPWYVGEIPTRESLGTLFAQRV